MKIGKSVIIIVFFIFQFLNSANTQSIESLIDELPPYFSILTTWGLRPEWDEKSDNPVVNKKGNMIAHQFGFQKGAGDGRGIFLFDLEASEKYKKDKKE